MSGFIVAKAALTWVVVNTWASYPERPGARHWHVELGPLAEWLAAGAAAIAAIVALYIAGRDRHQRIAERHEDEKTQARLVQVELSLITHSPVVFVKVRNYGSLPLLDVELTDAVWVGHQDARWVTNWKRDAPPGYAFAKVGTRRRILMPGTESHDRSWDRVAEFEVCFLDPTEDRPVRPIVPSIFQMPVYAQQDLSETAVQIRFTAANGVRWQVLTMGVVMTEPERL